MPKWVPMDNSGRNIYVEVDEEKKPDEVGYLEAFGIVMMTIFMTILKVFLFFLEKYPQALEDVRREDRARQNVSSHPRDGV